MAKKVLGYEDYIKKLEAIVQKLENGDISLEESLKLYTEGTELAALCEQKLKDAENQIKIVQTVV